MNSFGFLFITNFFISPSIMKDSFAEYSTQGWQLFSFSA
jgi:hypothetical protein